MNLEGTRSHDNFYLKEKRSKPKEYFKFIIKKINKNLNKKSVLDIGCATGDFLKYINSVYPNSKLYGLELNKSLIAKAKKQLPFVNKFYNLNILNAQNIGKFDYIIMSGVHSIFDDLYKPLKVLKKLKNNKNSKIYIFGIWNPYNVDAVVRLKKTSKNNWEQGWNVFSIKTLETKLKKLGLKYKVYKFNLKLKIKKNKHDLFRSWSYHYSSKKNIIINGSGIIHHFMLVEIY